MCNCCHLSNPLSDLSNIEKSEVVMMKTSAKGVSTFDKPPLTYKDRGEGINL